MSPQSQLGAHLTSTPSRLLCGACLVHVLSSDILWVSGGWLAAAYGVRMQDTFDLRRIDDLHFQRTILQRMFNRGTVSRRRQQRCLC